MPCENCKWIKKVAKHDEREPSMTGYICQVNPPQISFDGDGDYQSAYYPEVYLDWRCHLWEAGRGEGM